MYAFILVLGMLVIVDSLKFRILFELFSHSNHLLSYLVTYPLFV